MLSIFINQLKKSQGINYTNFRGEIYKFEFEILVVCVEISNKLRVKYVIEIFEI